MKKKISFILLVLIVLLAAYLRLYRISDYMTFLGDEGRDVLVAKGILEGHLTLLGPRASAGDFFLGPIYYYMVAPWLWLFRYDPVGPAIMVGLVGVATVWLTYFVGKKWFNAATGLFAAALYAVSPIVIIYSHSSWNPDVLPFFSLLIMYLLFEAFQAKQQWKYFLLVGFLLGIALQLHYLALFLLIIVCLYTFFVEWYSSRRPHFMITIKRYVQMLLGFLIGFSPFLAFETRHGFANIKTIFSFIFSGTLQQKSYETGATFFGTVSDVFFRVFAKLVFYYPSPDKYHNFSASQLQLFAWCTMLVTIAALLGIWFVKNKRVVLLVYLWLFLGVFLFGFYKKPIYDYYFTFLFPLPFLIIGNFLSQLLTFGKNNKQRILSVGVSLVLFCGIFVYDLSGMPFRYIPNHQKDQVKKISAFVISQTNNKPFNFGLISKGNSDHAYRYYLEVLGHKPITLGNTLDDPERKTVTDQLLVVCEDITCQPLGYSLFDIAGFGRAEIVNSWDVSVVKVYKLKHYTENGK